MKLTLLSAAVMLAAVTARAQNAKDDFWTLMEKTGQPSVVQLYQFTPHIRYPDTRESKENGVAIQVTPLPSYPVLDQTRKLTLLPAEAKAEPKIERGFSAERDFSMPRPFSETAVATFKDQFGVRWEVFHRDLDRAAGERCSSGAFPWSKGTKNCGLSLLPKDFGDREVVGYLFLSRRDSTAVFPLTSTAQLNQAKEMIRLQQQALSKHRASLVEQQKQAIEKLETEAKKDLGSGND